MEGVKLHILKWAKTQPLVKSDGHFKDGWSTRSRLKMVYAPHKTVYFVLDDTGNKQWSGDKAVKVIQVNVLDKKNSDWVLIGQASTILKAKKLTQDYVNRNLDRVVH